MTRNINLETFILTKNDFISSTKSSRINYQYNIHSRGLLFRYNTQWKGVIDQSESSTHKSCVIQIFFSQLKKHLFFILFLISWFDLSLCCSTLDEITLRCRTSATRWHHSLRKWAWARKKRWKFPFVALFVFSSTDMSFAPFTFQPWSRVIEFREPLKSD